MLSTFRVRDGRIEATDCSTTIDPEVIWVDLRNPTAEESALVERDLAIAVPTLDEAEVIDPSARIHRREDTHVMTAMVLVQVDTPEPRRTPIRFMLNAERLVTVRYVDSNAISRFVERATSGQEPSPTPIGLMTGIIEAVIDRQSELIESMQDEMDAIAHSVFIDQGRRYGVRRRYADILAAVGRHGEIASRASESLNSLHRLLTYFTLVTAEYGARRAVGARVKAAVRDVTSLTDHVNFLMNKVTFLLDATLGLIGIEQNNVVKVLSIAAVAFLPPTLIASAFGMNFDYLPGLDWVYSVPLVASAMFLSAAVPLWIMRRRGWI